MSHLADCLAAAQAEAQGLHAPRPAAAPRRMLRRGIVVALVLAGAGAAALLFAAGEPARAAVAPIEPPAWHPAALFSLLPAAPDAAASMPLPSD